MNLHECYECREIYNCWETLLIPMSNMTGFIWFYEWSCPCDEIDIYLWRNDSFLSVKWLILYECHDSYEWIWICTCMYVYIHMYMYTYTNIHVYICICILKCIYLYIYVYSEHIRVFIYTCLFTSLFVCMEAYMCIFICIYIYIHTYLKGDSGRNVARWGNAV